MKNPNPAYGAHLEPLCGIPTFMRQPASRDLEGIDVAIVGVPFDSGTSYRSGTRFGPRKIREASLILWGFNAVLGVAPVDALEIVNRFGVSGAPRDVGPAGEQVVIRGNELLREGQAVAVQDVDG